MAEQYLKNKTNGYFLPLLFVALLALLLARPAYNIPSARGPGSMHAPLIAALIAGLIMGILAQRTPSVLFVEYGTPSVWRVLPSLRLFHHFGCSLDR